MSDEVFNERVEHLLDGLIEQQARPCVGKGFAGVAIVMSEQREMVEGFVEIDEAGFDSVVKVGGEVGDLVCKIDELRF